MIEQDSNLIVALLDQELEPLHLPLHLLDLFPVGKCLLLRRLHFSIPEVGARISNGRGPSATSTLLLLHIGVEVFEVIEALIDHQTICQYDVLAWIRSSYEVLYHFVASIDVL